ncbi:MAG: serine/threonine-protein kinase PknK, partial [Spirochaetia bacterium]|nr:serine/threonine-protein kinase PknK [Spirochaetia bacterium]
MEQDIEGYTVTEEIYRNQKSIIYRAVENQSERSVIIKVLNSEYPTQHQIAKLKREYEIAQLLKETPGVVEVQNFLSFRNNYALVMEDIGGISLNKIIQSGKVLAQPSLIKIFIRLSETLGQIHQKGIIHKDIKPHNIILNINNGKAQLIDFSVSSQLSRENSFIINPESLEGTLNYISPEQTGRMNRNIDYRTDFYSLGITFYELLTGQLPFKGEDQLELLHLHIAKEAVPPSKIDGLKQSIPEYISDIVLKLIAKSAEDRYQSSFGLKSDLESCLDFLNGNSQVNGFSAGKNDRSDRFLLPQKLYGREKENQMIMNIFNRVLEGQNSFLAISGHPGIGKSMLIQEMQKPILKHRGYFISGKFDQFKRDIPYSALILAFEDLIRQLLTESGERIEFWKNKILKLLGPNSQIICEIVPELEHIIGKQEKLPELPPAESLNRFNLALQNFIKVFSGRKHTLTLFFDDLQWIDSATLKFIPQMLNDPESSGLFFIGSYRSSEVSEAHPLMQMIESISAGSFLYSENLYLNPLKEEDAVNLLKDAFHADGDKCNELGSILIKKTEGNPFFINEFLKTAYEKKLIFFNYDAGEWNWKTADIVSMEKTENLVDLMVSKINDLNESSKNVLMLASCFGTVFNLQHLQLLSRMDFGDLIQSLKDLLMEDFIIPLSENYRYIMNFSDTEANRTGSREEIAAHGKIEFKFMHDRILDAAGSLMDENEKNKIHYNLGIILLKNISENEFNESVIDIVTHLNCGRDLVTDASDRVEIAGMNLAAGKKAKSSAAFENALDFFRTGCRFLPENSWKTHYEITRDLYTDRAEMEYITANFENAESMFDLVLKNAKNILDKVPIYEMMIGYYATRHKMEESLTTGLKALKELGVNLNYRSGKISVIIELLRTNFFMKKRSIEELRNIP